MTNKNIEWQEQSRTPVFHTRIFSISDIKSTSPRGEDNTFSVIETNDWALVIPVLETEHGKEFVMVKQWRHGAHSISVEFPGGVVETGEEMIEGAKRELREETGYDAGKITHLGSMSTNPAIMGNHIHFFLAENLSTPGAQELDKDEFIEILRIPADEVIANMGKPPYIHAYIATGLFYYTRIKK